jgi:hypothetical protein
VDWRRAHHGVELLEAHAWSRHYRSSRDTYSTVDLAGRALCLGVLHTSGGGRNIYQSILPQTRQANPVWGNVELGQLAG